MNYFYAVFVAAMFVLGGLGVNSLIASESTQTARGITLADQASCDAGFKTMSCQ